jgi:hypothetical protein
MSRDDKSLIGSMVRPGFSMFFLENSCNLLSSMIYHLQTCCFKDAEIPVPKLILPVENQLVHVQVLTEPHTIAIPITSKGNRYSRHAPHAPQQLSV